MAWIAVHPDHTEDVQVPEGLDPADQVTFTVGFLPPRISEECDRLVDQIKKRPDAEPDDQDRFANELGIDREMLFRMAAFGIRDWHNLETPGGEIIRPAFVDEVIDGRPHARLAPMALDLLYHNRLLVVAALAVWRFNVLGGQEKKTSNGQPTSHGSNSPTAALHATPNGKVESPEQ